MTSPLNSPSDKVRKALIWVSEMLKQDTSLSRQKLLQQAEIRFDLSPADCSFLDKNFSNCTE